MQMLHTSVILICKGKYKEFRNDYSLLGLWFKGELKKETSAAASLFLEGELKTL
ncbi:hypothetical protein SAMN04487829_1407 [Pseudobutyrivibrio sp. NOR37]|nr:hypothetical protein SAMN04487829_1407 [Pseudobutyrivibrio sp. NOR37]